MDTDWSHRQEAQQGSCSGALVPCDHITSIQMCSLNNDDCSLNNDDCVLSSGPYITLPHIASLAQNFKVLNLYCVLKKKTRLIPLYWTRLYFVFMASLRSTVAWSSLYITFEGNRGHLVEPGSPIQGCMYNKCHSWYFALKLHFQQIPVRSCTTNKLG